MNAKVKEPEMPTTETVAEFQRVLQLIEAAAPPQTFRNNEHYYGETVLDGIHHPVTMCKFLPGLHLLVSGKVDIHEVARIYQCTPNMLRQHRTRRAERLSLMQAQGKLKFEEMVE